MIAHEPCVFLIDDDPAVRTSVSLLLTSMGHAVEAYDSAQRFLDAYRDGRPGCIVVDVRMPGMSGLELQGKLKSVGVSLPVIVITGYGDIPMAVRAMQAGAIRSWKNRFANRNCGKMSGRQSSSIRRLVAGPHSAPSGLSGSHVSPPPKGRYWTESWLDIPTNRSLPSWESASGPSRSAAPT